MSENGVVLVTGSHRSGSTWIGKSLALSGELGFIWEPFSRNYSPPHMLEAPPYWYFRVPEDTSHLWEERLRSVTEFDYGWLRKIHYYRSPRSFLKSLRDKWQFRGYRKAGLRPLLKDPIALMSADWIEDNFEAKVVVSVRHPAAFVESMVRQRGGHPWRDFLAQPALMDGLLRPYKQSILQASKGDLKKLEEHVLLWNILYGWLDSNLQMGRKWIVVRHEDLVENTVDGFQKLYGDLGLNFTEEVKEKLIESKRNTVAKWKTRLSSEEIAYIREESRQVWEKFYCDEDWV